MLKNYIGFEEFGRKKDAVIIDGKSCEEVYVTIKVANHKIKR